MRCAEEACYKLMSKGEGFNLCVIYYYVIIDLLTNSSCPLNSLSSRTGFNPMHSPIGVELKTSLVSFCNFVPTVPIFCNRDLTFSEASSGSSSSGSRATDASIVQLNQTFQKGI